MAYNTSTSATDINRCESYAQHVRVEQTCTTKRVYCLTQLVLCLSLMGIASPSLFVSKKEKERKRKPIIIITIIVIIIIIIYI